jgi:hypothetical protein
MKHTVNSLVALLFVGYSYSQCADEANITSFTYAGTDYEVVQENQTWIDAAACAVERGGQLIEINDINEQDAIFANLPAINFTNTTAQDGGGAGYLWIGGNDISTEGEWIWDGDNDGTGVQFWNGDANGTPVGGLYNNWGNEPDDFGAGQDALAYAITNWPLGLQEQWNDVDVNNTLYYIIEYPSLSVDPNDAQIKTKTLLKVVDLMGREVEEQANTLLIYIYDDGSSEKVFKAE